MTRRLTTIGILALLAASGLAVTATAQVTPERDDRARQPERQIDREPEARDAAQGVWELRHVSNLIGADLEDATGETIASVDDLIFEKGTGRWTHAIVKSGAVLGVGGKKVAVPASKIRATAGADEDEELVLDMTEAELEAMPEFDVEAWADLDHTSWLDEFGDWSTNDDDGADNDRDIDDRDLDDRDLDERDEKHRGADRYHDVDWAGAPETLTGTIRDINRSAGESREQETVLTVETSDGQTRRVVMGPTWYVAGHDVLLYRGDTVSLEVCPLPDGYDADFVAKTARRQGDTMALRDERGAGAWARSDGTKRSRLGLASDLVGAEVLMATDEETGEVQDAVVDLERQRIIMIALDPNENFLGIGDELKCVPWQLISFAGDDTVRLDTNKDALVSCEELPDDLTRVTSRAQIEPFFRPFNLDVERVDNRTAGNQQRPDAWREGGASAGGEQTVRALASGEDIEISGRLTAVHPERMDGFREPVMVATVSTDDGGSERVVLGPASHFDSHPHGLQTGDEVSIEAKRADVNGRKVTAACTIESANREIELWRDGQPVWS